ncbi:MAG: 16S rRNA (guanine(527)-N(7))-methyltransferase RsmG [Chloroflexota bacterium]
MDGIVDAASLGASPDAEPADSWPGLAAAVAARGIGITPGQVERLLAYRDLLLAWNERFNLTAVRESEAAERVLLLDSLLMLPAIDEAAAASGLRRPSLIDIGSGGGLPAIPLAICRPDLDITLVEATGKKVRFLDQAARELGLSGVRAIAARAEDLARDPAERERYDLATARAVASLPALIELATPFLREGGVALFPKGRAIEDELAAARTACRELGCQVASAATLPGGETMLVTVVKTGPTSARYPRRSGIPARQPLGLSGGAGR